VKRIILALLLVFCVASTASAANFVEICRDDYFLIYIDIDFLQPKGDYVTCWTKWIPRGKELEKVNKFFKKKVSHYMQFYAYKIYDRQSQELVKLVYFENGEFETFLNRNLTINGWKEIIPQTYGEMIWELVKIQ
jgi:hypothetical protein